MGRHQLAQACTSSKLRALLGAPSSFAGAPSNYWEKSFKPLSIFFLKKQLSRLSLPCRDSASSSSEFCFFFLGFCCFFIRLLLQSSSAPRFHLLHCSSRFCFFIVLRVSSSHCCRAMIRTVGLLLLQGTFLLRVLLFPPLLPTMTEIAIGKLLGCLRIT